MPDGMIRTELGIKFSSHFLDADIASMPPAALARRFAFLSGEGDRLGETGDRDGELAANQASFRAYEAVLQRPIGSLEDAMAVLMIAAAELYEAVEDRWVRQAAAPAWLSLGRVALFLARKEGVDPADYGGEIVHSGICGLPDRLRAGVWISRALRIGMRLLVSEQGKITLIFPSQTPENSQALAEIKTEHSLLDGKLLRDVLMSDINDTVNRPHQLDTLKVSGRGWLVSPARNGFSVLDAVELPEGAVA